MDSVEYNGLVYFSTNGEETGEELWVTDGTTEGERLLVDINPGESSSFPRDFIEYNGLFYFSADDGETGRELWASDGTTEGTQLIVDILPGPDAAFYGEPVNSSPGDFKVVNNKLFFTAFGPFSYVGDSGYTTNRASTDLFVTDGTSQGTQNLTDFGGGKYADRVVEVVEFKSKVYFGIYAGVYGDRSRDELWVSDGTTEGTKIAVDLENGRGYDYDIGSSVEQLTVFNDQLYFAADTSGGGQDLWVTTDGTQAGTSLVKDFATGDGAYGINSLRVEGDRLLFDSGNEQYQVLSDGSVSLVNPPEPTVIEGTGGRDNISGTDGDDTIKGLGGADNIDGGLGNDTLFGNAGKDLIVGGDGNDVLVGGAGDDTLDGGLGNDTLTGNGNDRFVLRAGDGADLIQDYVIGSDRLLLADGLTADELTFSGSDILLGDETLATLNNVSASNLRPFNFIEI